MPLAIQETAAPTCSSRASRRLATYTDARRHVSCTHQRRLRRPLKSIHTPELSPPRRPPQRRARSSRRRAAPPWRTAQSPKITRPSLRAARPRWKMSPPRKFPRPSTRRRLLPRPRRRPPRRAKVPRSAPFCLGASPLAACPACLPCARR